MCSLSLVGARGGAAGLFAVLLVFRGLIAACDPISFRSSYQALWTSWRLDLAPPVGIRLTTRSHRQAFHASPGVIRCTPLLCRRRAGGFGGSTRELCSSVVEGRALSVSPELAHVHAMFAVHIHEASATAHQYTPKSPPKRTRFAICSSSSSQEPSEGCAGQVKL